MKRLSCLLLLVVAGLQLTGCEVVDDGMQGNVRNLGDAITHCNNYTKTNVTGNPVISVDRFSTRQSSNFYDVFISLDTHNRHGYVHCQVNMAGLIVLHDIQGFRKGGGIFAFFK